MRVAYTVEQCWHRVPGGTAVAALEVAAELLGRPDLELRGVSARHQGPPLAELPAGLPVYPLRLRSSRSLYAAWLWAEHPVVERASGPVDVTHATTLVPAPSRAPLVVTVHDLAFVRAPGQFTRWGRAVFRRSLAVLRRRADLVLCSSTATLDDVAAAGVPADRLRLVPLGVRPAVVPAGAVDDVRARFGLPDRYLLFVGTVEPRKNLARLVDAVGRLEEPVTLVVAGPEGWGRPLPARADVRLLGRVSAPDRDALYAGASVFCYPSTWEGFGLPVLEAMASGTPVVTSRGISTEEVAGGAAVLVDPDDVDSIAAGITEALRRRSELAAAGRRRAAACSWAHTAELTVAAYREVAR